MVDEDGRNRWGVRMAEIACEYFAANFPINYRKDPSEGVLVGLFGNSWLEINFQPTLPINYRKDPSEGS